MNIVHLVTDPALVEIYSESRHHFVEGRGKHRFPEDTYGRVFNSCANQQTEMHHTLLVARLETEDGYIYWS